MLTTVAKRVQSSLKRKGVIATSGDIKDYLRSNSVNIENITKEEENNVIEYFLSNATKLTVVSDDVTTEVEETLTSEDVDIDSSELHTNEAALDTENDTALATATKSELVSSTAHSLGIVLDVGEISLIAENIGTSTDSLEQDIDAIESAIMAFVEHKAMISQQKINQMVSSVRRTVQHKNSENSQLLTDGLKSINSDIQDANKDFKSNVRTALKAFAIPAIKAG
ncbi:hypothetical protein VB713_26030 [Anabaena cylindrica UHCC 0172]|uniref:hypothetical protein n=1 Tax=Anabaena cylindrica TaxID=1165 RepID=UPI002B20902D|nr:hypothetical protein [Anabaena cylindrica]MEA5554397.1 hypothetical protein [Anabaena cylindrica UHCC 0172]